MTSYQRTLWEADPNKRTHLRGILRDPVFIEAVALAIAENHPDGSNIEVAALSGARAAGMHQLLESLTSITKYGEEQEKRKPKPKAWGHAVERSSFDSTKITTPEPKG